MDTYDTGKVSGFRMSFVPGTHFYRQKTEEEHEREFQQQLCALSESVEERRSSSSYNYVSCCVIAVAGACSRSCTDNISN